jgi:hypothetical protein
VGELNTRTKVFVLVFVVKVAPFPKLVVGMLFHCLRSFFLFFFFLRVLVYS